MSEKITRELVQPLGVLSRSESGWGKELNLVSWNGRKPKLDLREWSSGKEKIGKGITLKKSEALKLRDILNSIDFNTIPNTDEEEKSNVLPVNSSNSLIVGEKEAVAV